MDFEDVVIDDLDLRKTTWSRTHSSMRTLYLRLSREPDIAWVRFFHEERESRIVLKRHGLWVEDDYIVFDCLLADVERHHLPDFRLSVDYANQKSRELMQTQAEQFTQARVETLAEQKELAELRKRVRGEQPTQELPVKEAQEEAISEAVKPLAQETPQQPVANNPVEVSSPLNGAHGEAIDFNAKRDEWRARFRAALAAQNKESARGDD